MPTPGFLSLPNLADERIGGKVLFANDDFFAPKENLLKPGRGIFIEGKYTDHGKWMDGWESRRRRIPGHDWCIIQLGATGIIRGIDIDTNHFLGNHPPFASVDACYSPDGISEEMMKEEKTDPYKVLTQKSYNRNTWKEILPKSPLKPGSQNLFKVNYGEKITHLRLNIYPDGGVARIKVYGNVQKDISEFKKNELIDLAGILNGGCVLKCNNMFFSPKDNLILPGESLNMGDGWETKRNRKPGNVDWVIVKLGFPGFIKKVLIDTAFFKGNYPDSCELLGCLLTKEPKDISNNSVIWKRIFPQTKLHADTKHFFKNEIENSGPFSHVKLNIYPDGGIARLRIWGRVEKIENRK
ncbi:MAG: allantoicase [Bacteroidetes bacterium RIFCSPLOWO2_02_FULL_36_8]|nr:MAG: allantoicase [Bacteroidetes bacterium RIFCSPLOWO2_02_FULL_36_8]OFY69161.1 MAG: allantoicase [Bacteroidetes bacterium RIFCSPLOWO2_12_FULL_37_12]